MFLVSDVDSFGGVTPMEGIVVNLDRSFCVMDQRLFSNVAVGNAVLTFIWREVNIAHLLNLCSFVVLHFVRL